MKQAGEEGMGREKTEEEQEEVEEGRRRYYNTKRRGRRRHGPHGEEEKEEKDDGLSKNSERHGVILGSSSALTQVSSSKQAFDVWLCVFWMRLNRSEWPWQPEKISACTIIIIIIIIIILFVPCSCLFLPGV